MSTDNQPDFKKPEESEDSLETLNENLYSRRDYFSGRGNRFGQFKKRDLEVATNWRGESVSKKARPFQDPAKRLSFLKKLFLVSLIFFIVSAGAALYIFFGGGNVISSSNVDIAITGPVAAAGGEILPLEISVTNGNNADLETADLVIDYPDGAREPLNQSIPLKRYREAIGSIKKGETATKKVQAVLFGEEGAAKAVEISVEYRLRGSNAIFSKKKEYSVSISSSPVTLTVNSVKEVNANQEIELNIGVVSNANSIIQKLDLAAEYPFGFTFGSADPAPSWSNSFWQMGDLKPGVKRVIKIRGKIAGQDNEDRTFRFSVGTEDPKNENIIGTNFLTATQKITIRKPFIGASLALDGDTSDNYIAKPGKIIRADLTLSNNAGVKITDVKIAVKPTGNIFDPSSVSAGGGFYRSSDQTIIWDQTFRSGLAVLNPDETATLSFSFNVIPETDIRAMKNPEMTLSASVTGKRLNESGVSQDITSNVARSVRVASSLDLSARALYYSGPFSNSGPIPPKVDSETSYTVVWSLTNGSNDLSNVKVSATLPSYMKWLGATAPQSEKVSYNPIGGQVLWEVGDLKAGTGFSNSPRDVSFQISLVPSSSQLNSVPTLLSDAVATGEDGFAGVSVQAPSRAPLTTNLTTDVGFRQGQGIVTK